MNNNEKYLPIGSIVRLKEGSKNLMIIGFCTISPENPNVIMDYNGCMYPEGVLSSDVNFLFNHEQIEEILFKGYVNDEEINFKNKLNEFISNENLVKEKMNEISNLNITNDLQNSNEDIQLDVPILAQQNNNVNEDNSEIETL